MICQNENPEYEDYWVCQLYCELAYSVDSKEWSDSSGTGLEHICVNCMKRLKKEEE